MVLFICNACFRHFSFLPFLAKFFENVNQECEVCVLIVLKMLTYMSVWRSYYCVECGRAYVESTLVTAILVDSFQTAALGAYPYSEFYGYQ